MKPSFWDLEQLAARLNSVASFALQMSPSENRRHPRVRMGANASVYVASMGGTLLISKRITNISMGGAAIEMSDPPESGTRLVIEIRLSSTHRLFRCFVTVAWSRTKPKEVADRPPGIGVQFDELPGSDRQMLSDFVTTQISAAAP